jgi:small subunit ribosomal protein S6
MSQYELTVILPLDDEQQKKGREKLLEDLANAGLTIEKTTELGDRDLAYEIKGHRRAKYVNFVVKGDGAKIASLDKVFKLNGELVRYFFVKLDIKEAT